mmetsp:Transcript_15565/g.45025  ORF Transcript_15565/g.45025 Transcript_15565/m.45025 type:complete len:273 (-) Transcript_15565:1364-2182(-)
MEIFAVALHSTPPVDVRRYGSRRLDRLLIDIAIVFVPIGVERTLSKVPAIDAVIHLFFLLLELFRGETSIPRGLDAVAELEVIQAIRGLDGDLKALLKMKALDEIEGALHLSSLENIKEQLESDLINLSAHGIILVHELFVIGGDGNVDKLLLLERQIGTDLDVLQSTELAQSTARKRKSESKRRRDRPADGIGVFVASLERNAHKLAVHASDWPEGIVVGLAQSDSVKHWRPLPATAGGVDTGLRGQHGQHSVAIHHHEGVIVAETRPCHG